MGETGSAALTQADFERVVGEALDSLPKRFAAMVQNVVIAVEDEPSAEDLEALDGEGENGAEGAPECSASTAASH